MRQDTNREEGKEGKKERQEKEKKREKRGRGEKRERPKTQNSSPGLKTGPIGLFFCVPTNLDLADTIRYHKMVYLLYCGL